MPLLLSPPKQLSHGTIARNASQSANPGLWDGLVSAYVPSLGNTGLTLYDVSGNRFNGTLTNMVFSSAFSGWENDYIVYDAGNDFVDIPSHYSFASGESFSISVRLRVRNAASGYAVALGGATTNVGVHISVRNATEWRFGLWGGTALDTTADYALEQWRTLTGTFDGTSLRLYIQGKLVAGPTAATFLGNSTAFLGKLNNGSSVFNGSISTVLIHNRALNLNDIQAFHQDHQAPFRRRDLVIPYATPAAAATGRIMGSIAGAGGLAGPSGLAGTGGGIAG